MQVPSNMAVPLPVGSSTNTHTNPFEIDTDEGTECPYDTQGSPVASDHVAFNLLPQVSPAPGSSREHTRTPRTYRPTSALSPRRSPRVSVSPGSSSAYRQLGHGAPGDVPRKTLFDPSDEEELGVFSDDDDDDDESWRLSSSDSVMSFSSTSTIGDGEVVDAIIVDADADAGSRGASDQLMFSYKLEELYEKFCTLQVPVNTAPSSDEVIWHKGLGFILDEQPHLVTGNYCGGIYRGCINQDGVPDRCGYLVFHNDVFYFGGWKNGLEDGPGIMVWRNGRYITAIFKSGLMTGATGAMDMAAADLLIRDIYYWPSIWFGFYLW